MFDVTLVNSVVYLVCRRGGCSAQIQLQYDDRAVFSNANKHALSCWGLLTEAEAQDIQKNGAGKKRKAAAAAVIAAAGEPANLPKDDAAFRAAVWAQGITIGGLSPSLANNPGLQFIAQRLGWGPLVPPSTARDYLSRQAITIADEKKKFIKLLAAHKDSTITVAGRTENVRASFNVVHDNCTTKGGKQFMGVGVVAAMTQTELGAGVAATTTVRPKSIILVALSTLRRGASRWAGTQSRTATHPIRTTTKRDQGGLEAWGALRVELAKPEGCVKHGTSTAPSQATTGCYSVSTSRVPTGMCRQCWAEVVLQGISEGLKYLKYFTSLAGSVGLSLNRGFLVSEESTPS